MDTKEKTKGEVLAEALLSHPKNAYEFLAEEELSDANTLCEEYKTFLDAGKTEREFTAISVQFARDHGFLPYETGASYKAGDKVYYVQKNKAALFAVLGSAPLSDGLNIIGAHVDSPRLDLKPKPLFEDHELAYFKTHYYGGIRKYQWPTVPLSLHGVVATKDKGVVSVCVGEHESEPVFCITDLLPHLATEQNKGTLRDGIKGENLNVLIGSRPFLDDKISEKVKLNILALLHEKYGICEDDFISAELELVPAQKARDIGFDRSMIGAYGHDDRVCAYTALKALLAAEAPARTCICMFSDKEEVGSDGITGAQNDFIPQFFRRLAQGAGIDEITMLQNSFCLSADVNAAYDPIYPEPYDLRNSVVLNGGVCLTKYVGAGGKSGTSDASAEYLGALRALLDGAHVHWQTGGMGKVDAGGGGTIAKYVAKLNIDTIDAGVPVLSMHSPFEVVSKLDVYSTYKAFLSFNLSQL